MIKNILVANRGEIACRIITTAKNSNIKTYAIYSSVDSNTKHVQLADYSCLLGKSEAKDSYLNINKIIKIAIENNIDAIHPGYGFLSENYEFSKACEDNNIIFIGPKSKTIYDLGSKANAKNIMQKANIPIIPGYQGLENDPENLKAIATRIGYPILIKASAGGGGKGMRIVHKEKDFVSALKICQAEAFSSFADNSIIIEKYLIQPRHIEVQIFRDYYGNCVHLFDRDCSIQRRHQKIIEEAPAINLSLELRSKLHKAAISCANTTDYIGAGTVEFLVDKEQNNFYFLEMNTRLQVEHPVTEMITNLDLVKWQLLIADKKPIPLSQNQIICTGHSIEARIYAEDPTNNFMPSTGTITKLSFPQDIARIDSGILEKDKISVFYDPLLTKIIVHADTRINALDKLVQSLESSCILGVNNNINYLYNILTNTSFKKLPANTNFIEDNHQLLLEKFNHDLNSYLEKSLIYANIFHLLNINTFNCWRMNHNFTFNNNVTYKKNNYNVTITKIKNTNKCYINNKFILEINQDNFTQDLNTKKIIINTDSDYKNYSIRLENKEFNFVFNNIQKSTIAKSNNAIVAPMPGMIKEIFFNKGDIIKRESPLLVLEAMKMQHTILAPSNGKIIKINFVSGDTVEEGAVLLDLMENVNEPT